MSDILGAAGAVASGLAGIGNFGLGIANSIENKRINDLNYARQGEVFEWQKGMQERAWSREDSAVQRRVADLKAAGLNPVLAAGSAAQSSSPMHLNAPQQAPTDVSSAAAGLSSMGNIAQTIAGLLATKAQYDKTKAEADILKVDGWAKKREQAITVFEDLLQVEDPKYQGQPGVALMRRENAINENKQKMIATALSNYNAKIARLGGEKQEYDLDLAKSRGVMSNSSANDMADLYNFAANNNGGDALFMDLIIKMLGGVTGAIPKAVAK